MQRHTSNAVSVDVAMQNPRVKAAQSSEVSCTCHLLSPPLRLRPRRCQCRNQNLTRCRLLRMLPSCHNRPTCIECALQDSMLENGTHAAAVRGPCVSACIMRPCRHLLHKSLRYWIILIQRLPARLHTMGCALLHVHSIITHETTLFLACTPGFSDFGLYYQVCSTQHFLL